MLGNKDTAFKFTLQVYSVTAAWFLLWLYPSCCQKKKSYLHSLLNIQRAGISTWQMLLFTWRLDFPCTLIKFICWDRLNFLILKLLEFVNQVLLWSKQHVHGVAIFFRKIKDFFMEGSQRAHLDLSELWVIAPVYNCSAKWSLGEDTFSSHCQPCPLKVFVFKKGLSIMETLCWHLSSPVCLDLSNTLSHHQNLTLNISKELCQFKRHRSRPLCTIGILFFTMNVNNPLWTCRCRWTSWI